MSDLPTIDKVATGDKIRRIMRLKHMSIGQMQLALHMTSATQIYAWCRGDYMPSIDHFMQMAEILEVKIEDFLVKQDG